MTISSDAEPLEVNSTNGDILFFRLPESVQPGGEISLGMEFTSSRIELDDGGVFVSSFWLPTLWWDGVPHVNDYRVSLATPPDHALAVSGRRNEADGYFEGEGVREFGIYIGQGMKVETADVGGVLLTALFTEAGAEAGKYCLQAAADVVSFYRDWLGFYPFDFLYVLPGGPEVWGGYPMATGMVRIHGQEKFQTAAALHWKWITAHEIGHQYWGDYVLDGDDPPWLWIGLGVYADREYTLGRGIGAARQIRMMERFSDGVKKNYDTTIDVTPDERRKIDFDFNNVVTHGKGFSFISALELTMGRDAFQRAYKKALAEFGGTRLDWHDFQSICEQESGENLDWLFRQWVRANKYLYYRITSRRSVKRNNKWISEITLERDGTLAMPVPVRAVFEDGTSQTKFSDRTKKTDVLVFESDARLWEEIIDPENRLPMLSEPPPLPEGSVVEGIQALPYTGAGGEAKRFFRAALEEEMEDGRAWFKLGLVLFADGSYNEAYDSFAKTVDAKPSELTVFAAYAWMGQIQDLLGNRDQALIHYREALEHDQGDSMTHSQFGLKIDKAWIEKLLKEPFEW